MSELEAEIRAACERGDHDDAATVAIAGYGRELASYLAAVLRNAADADDVFARVSEELGEAMPGLEISKMADKDRMATRGW